MEATRTQYSNPNNQLANLDPNQLCELLESAEKGKIAYMSMRKDNIWRRIHTSNDQDILRLLSITHTALVFPNVKNLEQSINSRTCEKLDTALSSTRTLACDSRIALSPSTKENLNINDTTKKDAIDAIDDINRRGMIIIADMQQKNKHDVLNTDDDMPARLLNYIYGSKFQDWANKGKVQGSNDKQNKINPSRFHCGIVYEGYNQIATKTWNNGITYCKKAPNSGEAVAIISIGSMPNRKKENFTLEKANGLREKFKKLCASTDENVRRIVGTMCTLISHGHLFNPDLLKEFLKNFTEKTEKTFIEIMNLTKVNKENMETVSWTKEELECMFGTLPIDKKINKAKAEGKVEGIVETIEATPGDDIRTAVWKSLKLDDKTRNTVITELNKRGIIIENITKQPSGQHKAKTR